MATGAQSLGTVLVIDDEELVRNVSRLMLERIGYSVLLAADGTTGIALFEQDPQAVGTVLLDLTMPGLSGLETAARLRQIDSDVPIVLASGCSEDEAAARFTGLGLAGFLQKPFQIPALREKLEGARRP